MGERKCENDRETGLFPLSRFPLCWCNSLGDADDDVADLAEGAKRRENECHWRSDGGEKSMKEKTVRAMAATTTSETRASERTMTPTTLVHLAPLPLFILTSVSSPTPTSTRPWSEEAMALVARLELVCVELTESSEEEVVHGPKGHTAVEKERMKGKKERVKAEEGASEEAEREKKIVSRLSQVFSRHSHPSLKRHG